MSVPVKMGSEGQRKHPHSASETVEEIPSPGAWTNRTITTFVTSAGEATVTLQGMSNLTATQSPDLPSGGGIPPSHLPPSQDAQFHYLEHIPPPFLLALRCILR